MALLRSTVMASLVSGSSMGSPTLSALTAPEALDALASELAPARSALADGLATRVAQLSSEDAPGAELVALSHEAVDLYAPLADRLGMARWRAELEDAGFRVLAPDDYAHLASAVGDSPRLDQARMDHLTAVMQAVLDDLGLEGEVTGRVKSLYSTHRKMQRKGVGLDEITDRLALRVKVADEADCYRVFEAVRARFAVLEHETDDYIAHPKDNGYRSLHTALRSADHAEAFELQVRTFAMHAAAEQGAAAHWRYKLGA